MIIAFTGTPNLGQTFMDWSFNYLSGVNSVFQPKNGGWVDLQHSPIGEQNAHLYKKNHPVTLGEIESFIQDARVAERQSTHPITFFPIILDVDKTSNPMDRDEELINIYKSMLDLLVNEKIKIFMVKPTRQYPYLNERISKEMTEKDTIKSLYFGLDNPSIKQIRENVSMRIMTKRKRWLSKVAEFHDWSESKIEKTFTECEWITDTEKCVKDILEQVDITLDQNRIESWRIEKEKWVAKMTALETWYEKDLPYIAKSIVDKNDLEIGRNEKLDIFGQSMLMAYLMKNHNKRLVLPDDHFPENTRDLHRFLK
jgi:hypothetical protein